MSIIFRAILSRVFPLMALAGFLLAVYGMSTTPEQLSPKPLGRLSAVIGTGELD